MIRRTTWVFLAVFILLLGAAWYLQRNAGDDQAANTTPTPANEDLVDFEETSIQSIQVEAVSGDAVILARDESGAWVLQQPEAEATDQAGAEAFVTQLTNLSVVSTLQDPPAAGAAGLNPARRSITILLKDGSQEVLRVGNETPTGSGYYVQVEGKAPLFVVSKFGMDTVLGVLDAPPVATPTAEATPPPEAVGDETETPTSP